MYDRPIAEVLDPKKLLVAPAAEVGGTEGMVALSLVAEDFAVLTAAPEVGRAMVRSGLCATREEIAPPWEIAGLGEAAKVGELPHYRRVVEFEVAGVDHHSQRRVDGERYAIHQAVRHLDGTNGERPHFETLAGVDLQ